jgi:hypothetical protein
MIKEVCNGWSMQGALLRRTKIREEKKKNISESTYKNLPYSRYIYSARETDRRANYPGHQCRERDGEMNTPQERGKKIG